MANIPDHHVNYETFNTLSSRRTVIKGLFGSMLAVGLVSCGQRLPGTGGSDPVGLATPTATQANKPQKDGIGTKKATYTGHSQPVNDLAWSPDGKMVASASDDKTVQVWNAFSGQTLVTYKGHTHKVVSVSWSPDGQHIVSGGDFQEDGNKTIQVWEALTGKFVLSYTEDNNDVKVVRYSRNGRFIVSSGADVMVRIWQASDGTTLRSFPGGEPGSGILAVAWSPDDDIVAYSNGDDTTFYTHASDDKIVAFKGHDRAPASLAWSPDGKFLASASSDTTLRIWNKQNGSQVKSYTTADVSRPIVIWSPDGKLIASCGENNTVRLWNPQNGANRYVYKGHSDAINALVWSPNGDRIASAGADMTVQVWLAR